MAQPKRLGTGTFLIKKNEELVGEVLKQKHLAAIRREIGEVRR